MLFASTKLVHLGAAKVEEATFEEAAIASREAAYGLKFPPF